MPKNSTAVTTAERDRTIGYLLKEAPGARLPAVGSRRRMLERRAVRPQIVARVRRYVGLLGDLPVHRGQEALLLLAAVQVAIERLLGLIQRRFVTGDGRGVPRVGLARVGQRRLERVQPALIGVNPVVIGLER